MNWLNFSNSLNDEQQRHVRENMSEEELVIFDILTRPAPELIEEERAEVKKVARDLLARLKALLVLNWRQKSYEADHRGHAGYRATACLHAGALQPEMLGGVRACV